MATSNTPKNADTAIPILKDQGIPNICGAYAKGVSAQYAILSSAGGAEAVTFAGLGLSDMANATYVVLVQNQTDVADEAAVTAKTAQGFTVTGPDAADVLDILIVGQLKGQLAD